MPAQSLITPPLTLASAERLFWRQEWARHYPVWLYGAALWVWLFLVPGQTTETSQVLPWSILWTGALALALSGDDLRRGIDPLVRTLALDGRHRWQMRTAAAILGGVVFYLLGWVASTHEWAWHLWKLVAPGQFSEPPASNLTPFAPGHGLGLIATVAVLGSLAAAWYHGMVPGLLYAAAVGLAAYGCTGSDPALLWNFQYESFHHHTEQAKRAAMVAGACVAGSIAVWFIGSHHSARRPPIVTSGRSVPYVSILVAILGLVATASVILSTIQFLKDSGLSPEKDSPFPSPASTADRPWTGFWLVFTWVEIGVLAAWWTVQYRASRGQGGRRLTALSPRWLPWLGGTLAAIHLIAQPASLFSRIDPDLRSPWPFPIEPPPVSTTQSWTEAATGQQYDSLPPGYDVALWAHYSGRPHEPIAWRTGSLPLPKTSQTAIALHFDPTALWPHPIQFEVAVRGTNPLTLSDQVATGYGRSDFRVRLTAPRSAGGGEWVSRDSFLPASLDLRIFRPAFIQPTVQAHLEWSLILLPQRPGQPAVERPWHKILPPDVASLVGTANIVHRPLVRNWRRGGEGSGLRGIESELRNDFFLFVPALLLAGILLRHGRFAGPVFLAIAITSLLATIAADARRFHAERAIAQNPVFPAYQRDLARAISDISYFQDNRRHR
jgi:hypothetical protein